jgi:prepilin-type N-terminal cleavage/methylation domain-containing protein
MILLSPKFQDKNKAFTLVELMVAILIIGVLVTIMAGAVVKWMAWQRDPTNPNSSVSQTINTIKQAVTRITQDIQQKAKQDYQALSAGDKVYYQTLGNYFFSRNVTPAAIVIAEPEPNARAIQVYTNTQIIRNFPTLVGSISSLAPVYDLIDFNPSSPIQSIVLHNATNPPNFKNFYATMNSTSLAQQLLQV